jgi:hypothetical protein
MADMNTEVATPGTPAMMSEAASMTPAARVRRLLVKNPALLASVAAETFSDPRVFLKLLLVGEE